MKKNKFLSGVCGANSQAKTRSVLAVLAVLLTFGLLLAGCGKKDSGGDSGSGSASSSKSSGGGTKLTEKDFKYDMTADGTGVKLLTYIGDKGGKLVIPDTIEGFPVVALGDIDDLVNDEPQNSFYGFGEVTEKFLKDNPNRGRGNPGLLFRPRQRTDTPLVLLRQKRRGLLHLF